MTRLAAAKLYLGIVVLLILSLQGSGLHGWDWVLRVFALPAVPVALAAFVASRRTARGVDDVAPWEARQRRPPS